MLPVAGGVLALSASYLRQTFSRHVHENYAVGVIEAGALAFRYRGSRVVAPAGSISLAQPDVPHDGAPAVPEGWRYRMLYLPPAALALVLPPNAPAPYFRPGMVEDPKLAEVLRRTHCLLMDPGFPRMAMEARLMAVLAAWIARHAEGRPAAPPVGREPRAVGLALELLAATFAENPSLSDLSRETGLSPWHLARAITRHTGLPPHAHLMELRCRAARERLSGPERLADIAAAVGFADQSHLTRAFRARFGLSPGAYRKILQNPEADAR